ncbi:amidohydrolase family protein [Cupriavidus respiraculi]|uniref:amidohydrolase family protein n=1 Tax=Cupriavidus respiraculi TaxID=195930 RepID=UPI001C9738F1|nr:amidohydrolase family protein [Cupriavidus respiraculi]MBY4945876.1 amidohydrolase family protein [Cupriavidus respiraculi]
MVPNTTNLNTHAARGSALLIRGAAAVMTGRAGDAARAGAADIRIRDGRIAEMGPALPRLDGEEVLDASGCVVYPGWVNTHHHLFQNLLKAVPGGINAGLEQWLASVAYPRLARFTPEIFRIAVRLGMAELLLSGTTTCADHHYLYHHGEGADTGDVLFEVAEELGMRLVLCRGGAIQSAAEHPGMRATALVPETLDQMLADIERLKARYHDAAPDGLRRVVVAPTTPTFSLPPGLLRELAAFARGMDLRLHTHLSETDNYVRFCREKYQCTPVQFVADHDWLGPDVWFAHLVTVNPEEIRMLAVTRTGMAHCPVSNARLGSGIAPVRAMADAGVPVSLGVDGVASNESGSMVNEANFAWLVHRALGGAAQTRVEEVIHWGTAGGAQVLGLPGIGTLAPGQSADLAIYDVGGLRFHGFHDIGTAPVAAGEPTPVRDVLVRGRRVVRDGAVVGLDLERLRREARQALAALVD